MDKKILCVILFLVCSLAAAGAPVVYRANNAPNPDVPEPSDSLVLDFADIVGAAAQQQMDEDIEGLYADAAATLVVVTVDTFDGMNPEQYAMALFNAWGIGNAERNDGILLLLAVEDREVFLMPGAGIKHLFTGETAGALLDAHFIETVLATDGDMEAALAATVKAVRAYYTGVYQTEGITYQQP